MKTKTSNSKVATTRLLLWISALALITVGCFKIAQVTVKVLETQFQLAAIADDIQFYNEQVRKTDTMTDEANQLFAARNALMHSDDPIVALAARPGFSIVIVLLGIAILLVLCGLVAYVVTHPYRVSTVTARTILRIAKFFGK